MNNKVFIMLANGFELIEAMAPVDILRRAGLDVLTVSTLEESLEVESAQKVKIIADVNISEINIGEGVMVVIPGGFPGYINLRTDSKIIEVVETYLNDKNKFVGSICGGPTLLGLNNLIGDYKFTCHSSVKDEMNSENYIHQDIVIDRNLITGIGAGKSLEFGFALAEKLVNKEVIERVKNGMELL
ncbi:DJ-1 family glyoxalase III [uncultured Cetobacterium sp.]|uniref:DJ-1 family glyoxalase III n=1 Tax=uncultured Cetobacterium sp. TaxID=527638 RepID=UPI002609074A|nr:DJ-1 family glyoxalase III [uncultured Cetobacterium sp.]